MTTIAPFAASEREVSSPRPPDAPVTKNRRPVRLIPPKTSSVVEVAENPLFVVMSEAYVRGAHTNETRTHSIIDRAVRRQTNDQTLV